MEASETIKLLQGVDPHGDDPAIPAGIGNLCRLAEETIHQQAAEIERLQKQVNTGDYACLRELALIREASGHGSKPMLSEFTELIAKDYAKLARLRAVVERLHVDAEGNHLTPGDHRWMKSDQQVMVTAIDWKHESDVWVRAIGDGLGTESALVDALTLYSTRAAAAAAMEGGGDAP